MGTAFFSMHMAYCEFGEKVIFRLGEVQRERAWSGTVSDALGRNLEASEDSDECLRKLELGQIFWNSLDGPEAEMEHQASWMGSAQFSSVQSLTPVQLFATP